MNTAKTWIFLTCLTLLFIWIGGMLGGQGGMTFAFFLACLTNFGAYWFSDRIVLAMYGARPLSESEAPAIHTMVRELTREGGMPMPRIFRIPSRTANAFATGRDPGNAAVAVTDGILEILGENELRGVLAHELAHVKHRDILISTLAATLAGAISMLASMARWTFMFGGAGSRGRDGEGTNPLAYLVMIIVAPVAALLVQLAVSRSREF